MLEWIGGRLSSQLSTGGAQMIPGCGCAVEIAVAMDPPLDRFVSGLLALWSSRGVDSGAELCVRF
jgi:hypothetical protein